MESGGQEQVVHFFDKATGLKAIVAIHNTHLGPALGGTRMWTYKTEEEALTDVLRLSRGMNYRSELGWRKGCNYWRCQIAEIGSHASSFR
jgi:leucine dehydrogenase